MSFKTSRQSVLRSKTLSTRAIKKWIRNPNWPTLANPGASDETFVALFAVWPTTNNFAVLSFTTNSGNYEVDWGDGTVVSTASNVQTNYNYDYTNIALDGTNAPAILNATADRVERTAHGYTDGMTVALFDVATTTGVVSGQIYYVVNATANDFQVSATPGGSALAMTTDGTCNLLPYKIAVVTVTPVTGGSLLGAVNLNLLHNQSGLVAGLASGWLEIKMAHTGITPTITLSGTNSASRYLEHVVIVKTNATTGFNGILGGNAPNLQRFELIDGSLITSFNALFSAMRNLIEVVIGTVGSLTDTANMFSNCSSLENVPLFDTASVTTISGMFSSCLCLLRVPLFNTASVTNMSSMFSACYSLENVPLFNTVSVTSMSGMFANCRALNIVPLLNTASVTTMQSMFAGCYSLNTVPLFNTSSVTIMQEMFSAASKLETVPMFNTASVTNMNSMFTSCNSLLYVPLFNTASVTNTAAMFSNCTSLETVPPFNFAVLTGCNLMFSNCSTLKSVPLFNTASVTNMSSMFNNCSALETVPLFNTASVTTAGTMFGGCTALKEIPAFNFAAVSSSTNFSNGFQNCKLARIRSTGLRFTHTIASNIMSADALDEYYTNLPTITSQTLTVTGNYGTTTDTPTIATSKGWTITGS